MDSVRVRQIPIGVNASVRYKGCDVDKWLEFGQQIARVRLVSRDRAACQLSNGKTAWAQLNELERVSPRELQSVPPHSSATTTQKTLQESPLHPTTPAQPITANTAELHRRTTQDRPIDPTRRIELVDQVPIHPPAPPLVRPNRTDDRVEAFT